MLRTGQASDSSTPPLFSGDPILPDGIFMYYRAPKKLFKLERGISLFLARIERTLGLREALLGPNPPFAST